MLEGGYGLRNAVLKDVEVVAGEVVDEVALLVENGGAEHDLLHVAAKGIAAVRLVDVAWLRGGGGRGADAWLDGGIVAGIGRADRVALDIERLLGFGRVDGCGGLCKRRGWRDQQQEGKGEQGGLVTEQAHSSRTGHAP